MARIDVPVTEQQAEQPKKGDSSGNFARVAKYSLVRAIALLLTVVVGVYLMVLIANMGGYVDDIRKAQIREQVGMAIMGDEELMRMPREEREEIIGDMVRVQEERLGLDQPFLIRSFRYLGNAITLNLHRAEQLTSDAGSRQVRNIILERLAPTLYLFGTAQLILFFLALFFALKLSRQYGSRLDRSIIALAPTSAAPPWFYGLFLILIFSAIFRLLPFGGMVASPPPPGIAYYVSLLRHLILPVTAVVIGGLFAAIYSWRTFFLIYSSDDYVEMARAKGLAAIDIERRYILRPTLPPIVTNFMLMLIFMWVGQITLELVFNWPGLGRLFYEAIQVYDSPVIIGSTVIIAYLLAVTVFVLDFIYAIVDPRVKIGGDQKKS